jgi:hypothetical protein
MNAASKIAVLALLSGIVGCEHKTQANPPAAAQAPIYPPSAVANDAPGPQIPPPKPPDVKEDSPTVVQQQPPQKPRKKGGHRQKQTEPAESQVAKDTAPQASGTTATTEQAAAAEPPAMSPIGQLSTTGDHSGVPTHQAIQDQITTTERGLNNIKRTLNADEQATATQIRTFITKAQQALDQDDLDGANTLVTKAKVLLEELLKGS